MRRPEYFLFAVVYFVQGALALTSVALPVFLRDLLGLSIPEIATLSAIASLPWVLKPVYGVVSDYYPVAGLRRKPYIWAMTLLASFGWVLTAINGSYWSVLFAQVCAALGIAMTDVVVDGLAVEKSTKKTKGVIQSVCWGARSVGAVVAGVTGGYLLTIVSSRSVFLLTAALPLLAFGTSFFVKEKPVARSKKNLGAFISNILRTYAKTPLLWWVALFLFSWYVAPSFGTPLFFFVKDQLGLSETYLGLLASMSSLGGVVAALLYGKWLDRLSPGIVLPAIIVINALASLLFYLVLGAESALLVYFVSGAVAIIATIVSMRVIVSVCPRGIEATTFAVFTSITNFGSGVVAQYLGGQLYALIGYKMLILVNAGLSLVPLLFLKKILDHL